MIVADRMVFSGVEASGVSVTFCVTDCPGWSVTVAGPDTDTPLDAVADSVTASATLPTFVIVTASGTDTPGVASTVAGTAVRVTPRTAGTVNVTVCVMVVRVDVVLSP